jgi:hypothetical protein
MNDAPNIGSPAGSRGVDSSLILTALLGPAQLFIFGPLAIYVGNPEELATPLGQLAVLLVPAFLFASATLVGIGRILPDRYRDRYTSLLLATGVLMWIQSSLLVASYGVLDGDVLDFDRHQVRGYIELPFWLGCLTLAFNRAGRISSQATFLATALLVLQSAAAVYSAALGEGAVRSDRTPWMQPPPEFFSFAPSQNVIHFVLDGFQSEYFGEAMQSDGGRLAKAFAGFTFYANHAGAFPTTVVSMTAMLSGRTYENDMPIPDFIGTDAPNLFDALSRDGWEVDSMSISRAIEPGAATRGYSIHNNFLGGREQQRNTAALLLDLSLFRQLPHFGKILVYNQQRWIFQSIASRGGLGGTLGDLGHHASNGAAFISYLTSQAVVDPKRERTFKFVHVGIPHWPMVVDAECRFTGVQRALHESYTQQSRCGLKRLEEFFARLKELGIYDDALILITSDHGTAYLAHDENRPRPGRIQDIVSLGLALFAIKEPGAVAGFKTSDVPTSIADIPGLIAQSLDLSEKFAETPDILLKEFPARKRRYGHYNWRDAWWREPQIPRIDYFAIEGDVRDARAWRYEESSFAPGYSLAARKIQPGDRATREYLDHGWESVGNGRARPVGEASRVFMELPAGRRVRITAILRSIEEPLPDVISIEVDGLPLSLVNDDPGRRRGHYSVTMEPDDGRPRISTIAFKLGQGPAPYQMADLEVEEISVDVL